MDGTFYTLYYIISIILIALNILDHFKTNEVIDNGGREANWILKYSINKIGRKPTWLLKLFVVTSVVLVLYYAAVNQWLGMKISIALMLISIFCVPFVWVAYHNFNVLKKQKAKRSLK